MTRTSLAGLLLTLFVAGCSSFGGPTPGTQAIRFANADLGSAIFAVDLPNSVEAVTLGPRVTYGTSLDITLVRADAEQVMAALPPPAEGRSYAVFAVSEADRPRVQAALTAAASLPVAPLVVVPRLCVTAETKKDRDRVAVLAVVPGQSPITLVPPETLLALENRAGATLPMCEGHSG